MMRQWPCFFFLGVSVESTTVLRQEVATGVRHISSCCDDIMAFTHEQLRPPEKGNF